MKKIQQRNVLTTLKETKLAVYDGNKQNLLKEFFFPGR